LPAATPAATPHNPHTALPSPPVAPFLHSHIRHTAAQTRAPLFPSTTHHSRCGASSPPTHAPALLPAAASPATAALAQDQMLALPLLAPASAFPLLVPPQSRLRSPSPPLSHGTLPQFPAPD